MTAGIQSGDSGDPVPPGDSGAPGDPGPPGDLRIERGVAWLRLDDPAHRVNTLSSRLLAWLEPLLARLESEPFAGLVILSGKPDGFAAGADLAELARLARRPDDILALISRGHRALGRIAALPFPTVAAIHGACLGGGLELALACRRRVATDTLSTRFGLPEVQLGLIPGLGGTQRLPRLVGVGAALDLILGGRQIDALQALRLGLIDDVCAAGGLTAAAARQLDPAAASPRAPRRPLAARLADRIARLPIAGALVWRRARRQVRERAGEHYPAPRVAIEVVRRGLRLPLDRGLELEAGAFAKLAASDPAESLLALFLARREADARADETARGARPVARVAVLGAGLMGAGIAQVLAERGIHVVLKERDQGALGRGMAAIAAGLRQRPAGRRSGEAEAGTALARVRPTLRPEALRNVDLVVEAVFEDLELKRAVLREVEAHAPETVVYASNTSSIPIASIAAASGRQDAAGGPRAVVGMHFFSPVPRMPLLEVIRHRQSDPAAVATAVAIGRAMRKTVIVVEDGPGFFTTRVLAPLLNEAAWLLAEGARIEQVDAAMVAWGWPLGPFALLDEVGIDVGAHVAAVLHESFGERLLPPPALARLVAAGHLGRKAGAGFYRAEAPERRSAGARAAGRGGARAAGRDEAVRVRRRSRRPDERVYQLIGWRPRPVRKQEIVERCWLQMLDETARCLDEGVIASPAAADLAVVLGLGFPPFRGGVLRQADRTGLAAVVARLDALAVRHGSRFTAAPLLRDMAQRGERFFPPTSGPEPGSTEPPG